MKFASKGKILDFYILSIFADRELYGYQIMKEAEKHKVSQSSFYKSLRRLEDAKFLAVRIEVCSGRLRKYYWITAAGATPAVTGGSGNTADGAVAGQSDTEAKIQEYVDTYSAMQPQDAVQIFDGIMPDQSDLVARILQKMKADQRAGILSQMNVDNAAILTVKLATLK